MAMSTLADGKFFAPVALPDKVTIPDQRALIHFTNGVERLVIETRFTGEGTNFAWVIPLPSQPVVEEATTGLFPTLAHLFRPQIKHDVPRYYLLVLFLILIGCMGRFIAKSTRYALVIAFLVILAGLFLSGLPLGSKAGISSTASSGSVSILDRKLVGIFETTTISSCDPNALQAWLRGNGFAVPTNSEPVIESYVKEGWVFVAVNVRRDDPKLDTSTAHPLSFTFKTDKPVYPMRLTGVDNGPVRVELYVFGPRCARARNFKVQRCVKPDYPAIPTEGRAWTIRLPARPTIVHPLLRKWVAGAPVATKLTATLNHAQMREDVWLQWSAFKEKKNWLYSRKGALTVALNWAAGCAAIGMLAIWLGRSVFGKLTFKHFTVLAAVALLTSAILGCIIYLALPKTKVRLVRFPTLLAQEAMHALYMELNDATTGSLAETRKAARQVLEQPGEWVAFMEVAKRHGGTGWYNFILGNQIHEEDSPGNFILRESCGVVEFVAYDALGAEHVIGKLGPAGPN